MIKDIQSFSKLFKVPVPKFDELKYYLDTLARSPEHKHIWALATRFAAFEIKVGSQGVDPYKRAVSARIIDYFKNTRAYRTMNVPLPLPPRPRNIKPAWKHFPDHVFCSIDIIAANYNVLKKFSSGGELQGSWEEQCRTFEMDPILAESKSFRQIIFGNLNPKRSARFQGLFMGKLLDKMIERGCQLSQIAFMSPDEVVLAASDNQKMGEMLDQFFYPANRELSEDSGAFPLPVKLTRFRLKPLGSNMYLRTECWDNSSMVRYKTLFGVPRSMFYMLFKEHVLGEPLEERDLFFWTEKKLAKWVVS